MLSVIEKESTYLMVEQDIEVARGSINLGNQTQRSHRSDAPEPSYLDIHAIQLYQVRQLRTLSGVIEGTGA